MPRMDLRHLVREDLEAHPGRLRGLLQGAVGLLMEAEVSARCGAGDGEHGPEQEGP